MGKGDLTKAEEKWRNRPLFRRRRNPAGILGATLLVIIIIVLASYGILAGNTILDSVLSHVSISASGADVPR